MTATATATPLMRYREERALEHAAFTLGAAPTRIHAVLLPVWCVEIEADVTEGEPYELIDRYLSRGIAEAGLDTPEQLTAFFALDAAVVGQALRFLGRIGHITDAAGGRLALTELGYRSLRDDRRYAHTRRDRRKLYFDAFTCHPLTRPYYDERKVTYLAGDELAAAADRRNGPRFHALKSRRYFHDTALAELAHHPERDRFNLPDSIDNPRSLDAPEELFLPAYVVRAVEPGGRVRHLVYTSATDRASDAELEAACGAATAVTSAMEDEEAEAAREDFATRAGRWLSKQGLARHRPVRTANGGWRVTLPPGRFGPDGPLSYARLGSFVVLGTGFLQLWCEDETARRRALVERIDSYLGSLSRVGRQTLTERIESIARQLGLGRVSLDDVRHAAERAGKRGLAAQLARLTRPEG